MNSLNLTLFACFFLVLSSCKKDPEIPIVTPDLTDSTDLFTPTPYNISIPTGFPDMVIPTDNPMTEEGVELGKKLFYDPILSGNFTQSCGSCHAQEFSFTDNELQFSIGVDNIPGTRNTPSLINAGWNTSQFWDGRASTLEDQALGPVPNPIEMHLSWEEAEKRLNQHSLYPELFKKAFNIDRIDSIHVAKAIAQFERTLISANSKYDQFLNSGQQPIQFFTQQEFEGYFIYFTERGDCFHCHGTRLTTDNDFHNNGLDETITDLGLGAVTGNANDAGKFKTPTLRNIEFTAPYMHDGRFATLEDVIDFYSSGLHLSPTIDPLMKKATQGGVNLTSSEKQSLIAFLKTFSDPDFNSNDQFSNP